MEPACTPAGEVPDPDLLQIPEPESVGEVVLAARDRPDRPPLRQVTVLGAALPELASATAVGEVAVYPPGRSASRGVHRASPVVAA
jgi:hypothetical protein